jgi:hypothetical protein
MKEKRVGRVASHQAGSRGDPHALIGSCRQLRRGKPSSVPASDIGEGSADIDPDRHLANADVEGNPDMEAG